MKKKMKYDKMKNGNKLGMQLKKKKTSKEKNEGDMQSLMETKM